MKRYIFPLALIGFTLVVFSCSKDDSDTNAQRAPQTTGSATTSSTNPVASTSYDNLVFDKDTVKQFGKSKSVVSNHFVLKATHITGDPIINITLADIVFPETIPSTYEITQSVLSNGKCGLTITYNSRFYVAASGTVVATNVKGKKAFSLNVVCLSASDSQSRKLSGLITLE